MKQPMKKTTKIILGLLLAALLIGVCFSSVTLYVKRELGKPTFTLPDETPQYTCEAPADAAEAADCAARLFAAAQEADDTLVDLHTDVSLEGDWQTPFSAADAQTLQYIAEEAAAGIAALYPSVSGAAASQTALLLPVIRAADVLSFSAETDETRLVLTLQTDPDSVDAQALLQSEVCTQIVGTLSDALTVERAEIVPVSASVRMEIDRFSDRLLTAEVQNAYRVHATVRLAEGYRALSAQETVEITLPYETVRHMTLTHFGARFTERAIAVNPGDRKTLPVEVTVREDASEDDYTLVFTSSAPDVLTFDSDGMTTVERLADEPVTVTMTLRYDGHVYTDTLTVYVTQWEVSSGD